VPIGPKNSSFESATREKGKDKKRQELKVKQAERRGGNRGWLPGIKGIRVVSPAKGGYGGKKKRAGGKQSETETGDCLPYTNRFTSKHLGREKNFYWGVKGARKGYKKYWGGVFGCRQYDISLKKKGWEEQQGPR